MSLPPKPFYDSMIHSMINFWFALSLYVCFCCLQIKFFLKQKKLPVWKSSQMLAHPSGDGALAACSCFLYSHKYAEPFRQADRVNSLYNVSLLNEFAALSLLKRSSDTELIVDISRGPVPPRDGPSRLQGWEVSPLRCQQEKLQVLYRSWKVLLN